MFTFTTAYEHFKGSNDIWTVILLLLVLILSLCLLCYMIADSIRTKKKKKKSHMQAVEEACKMLTTLQGYADKVSNVASHEQIMEASDELWKTRLKFKNKKHRIAVENACKILEEYSEALWSLGSYATNARFTCRRIVWDLKEIY